MYADPVQVSGYLTRTGEVETWRILLEHGRVFLPSILVFEHIVSKLVDCSSCKGELSCRIIQGRVSFFSQVGIATLEYIQTISGCVLIWIESSSTRSINVRSWKFTDEFKYRDFIISSTVKLILSAMLVPLLTPVVWCCSSNKALCEGSEYNGSKAE